MTFHKYQGAGNDFILVDNRDGRIAYPDGILKWTDAVHGERRMSVAQICDRRYGVGADGMMLLESSSVADFRMVYFNSDGSGGMMCGNGGRCIAAFAADLGLLSFRFEAADGLHEAEILHADSLSKTIRLKMKDVSEWVHYDRLSGPAVPSDGYFLDTGTRHFVRFVDSVGSFPVAEQGRDIRFHAQELLPVGANVNFVEPTEGGIRVRTYEKGVEDETFACGTGIVASAIASYLAGVCPSSQEDGRVRYDVSAKRDALAVDFIPSVDGKSFRDVRLTGSAVQVACFVIP